ncbi:hypothetical protein [Paracoccus sp. (in: a-proteobacteria)]|uniref:hypothetical protein n=1 Tax=Paracoccus sp. TaxID=267 RepID=UPI00289AA1F3|nr:hypothetical protein [Paracoccus sp. (in: a-proteobacteria)]
MGRNLRSGKGSLLPAASYLNHKMTAREGDVAHQRAIDGLDLSINVAEQHIIDHSAVAIAKRHSDVLMWLGLIG